MEITIEKVKIIIADLTIENNILKQELAHKEMEIAALKRNQERALELVKKVDHG